MDEPAVLPIGTEVSAKYKGAFCEAKIKKISRNVRFKITPIDNQYSQSVVNESEIQSGQLKVGQTLSARLPNGNIVNATLNKVFDQSQYTVVFDDGDIATLKRTSLCLKSGKHFAESDTLDQLPLTNPEHFGNPVSLGRRRTRKNIFSPGDTPLSKRTKLISTPSTSSTVASLSSSRLAREQCSESDSDSEKLSASSSSIATTTTPGRKRDTLKETKEGSNKFSSFWKSLKDGGDGWGKVVCLEYADKRGAKNKDPWFPALVISESANKSDLYTVKSFCDDRLYKVSFKDAKEFNKSQVKQFISSGECSPELKVAIEKAFKYLEQNMLPENWSLSPRKIPIKKTCKTESIGSADTGEDEQSNSSSLTSGSRRKLFKKFDDILQDDEELEDEFTDSNVEIEDDDDEDERKEKLRRQQQQQEERDLFVAQLYKFMDERGTPINNCPMVNGKELNLYKLHQLVNRLGGPNKVTNKNAWKRIFDKLGLKADSEADEDGQKTRMFSPSSISESDDSDESSGSGERLLKSPVSLLKKAYHKYVYPFYDLNRKLGSATYISLDFSRKASRPSRGERKREEERSRANTNTGSKAGKGKDSELGKKSVRKQDNGSETETTGKGSRTVKNIEEEIKTENTDSQVTAPSLAADIGEFDDDLAGSEQDKFGESNIRIGDGLKVKYGKGKQLKVYDAKVLKTEYDSGLSEFKYYVHYYGWSSRYDEWINKARIVDVLRDKSPRRRTGKVKNKGEPLIGLEESVEEDEEHDSAGGSSRTHTKSESSVTLKASKMLKNQASLHKERSNSLSKVKSLIEEPKSQRRNRTSSYSEKTSQPSPRRLDKMKDEDKNTKKFYKQTDMKEKNIKDKKEVKEEKVKEESDDDTSLKKKDRKRSREEEKEKVGKKAEKNDAKKDKIDKRKGSDDEKKKVTTEERTKRNDAIKKRKEDKKADKKSDNDDQEEESELKKDIKKVKSVEEASEKSASKNQDSQEIAKNSRSEDSKTKRKSSTEDVKSGKGKNSKEDKVIEETLEPEIEPKPVIKEEKEIVEAVSQVTLIDSIIEEKKKPEVLSKDDDAKESLLEVTKTVESFIEDLDTSPRSSLVIVEEDNESEAKDKTQKAEIKEASELKEKNSKKNLKHDALEVENVSENDNKKKVEDKIEIELKVYSNSEITEPEISYEAIDSPTPIGEENPLVCDETIPISPISNTEDIGEDNCDKMNVTSVSDSANIFPTSNDPPTHMNLFPVDKLLQNQSESLICDEKLFEDISDEEDILEFSSESEPKKVEVENNFSTALPPESFVLHPQTMNENILQQFQQIPLSLPLPQPSILPKHQMPVPLLQMPKPTLQTLPSKPPKVIVPSNIASSIMKLVPGKSKALREEEEDNKGTLADDEEMDDDDDDDDKTDSKKSVKMSKKRDNRNVASKNSSVSNSPRVNRSPDSSIDDDDNSVGEEEDADDDDDDDDNDNDNDNDDTGGSGGDKFERKNFRARKREIEEKFKSPELSPKKRRRGRTRSISSDVKDNKSQGKTAALVSAVISANLSANKETRTSRRGSSRKGPSSPAASLSDGNNSDDNLSQSYESSNPKILLETISQLSPVRDCPADYSSWASLHSFKFYLLEPIDTSLPSGKIVEILTDRINICRKNYSELKAKLADAERRKKKLEKEEKDRERKAAKEQAKSNKNTSCGIGTVDGSDSDSDSDNASGNKKTGFKKSSSVDSSTTALPMES